MPKENVIEEEFIGEALKQFGNGIDRCGQDRCTGSAGMELIFFIAAGTVLCFRFVTKTMLKTS